MGQAEPNDLVVTAADRLWSFRVSRPEVRDHLAEWLGPWARPAGAGDEVAGVVVMTAGESTGVPPRRQGSQDRQGRPSLARSDVLGVLAVPGSFSFFSDEYDLLVTPVEGGDDAEARYAEGFHTTAARAALRALASRFTLAEGGVVLHASSVRTPEGILVFAGPSGAGKTSAASAFRPGDRLDSDLVLLAERGRRWVRLDLFDEYAPPRFAPGTADGVAVRAVLLPQAADRFELRLLSGAEAVRGCLHLAPGTEDIGTVEATEILARVEGLARAVPIARLAWSLSDDLPSAVEEALSKR